MNAISKRLLSWLCVIAMVLSFAPVMDLSDFAVETQASSTVGSANLDAIENATEKATATAKVGDIVDNSDDALLNAETGYKATNYCPVCGDISGLSSTEQWQRLGTGNTSRTAAGKKYHYYVDSAATATSIRTTSAAVGTSVCIWLADTLTVSSYVRVGSGTTFNFMGDGALVNNDTELIEVSEGATLNLYGGTFAPTATNTNGAVAFVKLSSETGGRTLNIYDDAVIGPETKGTTACMNVTYGTDITSGTINMYGGTIRNGVSGTTRVSANVHVPADATFNMYGGTISGGGYIADKTGATARGANLFVAGTANIYGGTITGGNAAQGGNIAVAASGKFNMQGGAVKLGVATENGGNIWSAANSTIGGTALIEGGSAADGGNIYVYQNKVTTSGTIRGGEATNKGGNVYIKLTSGTGSMETSGDIAGGTAPDGGNIYAMSGTTLTVTGGTIVGDVAGVGSVTVSNDAQIVTEGTVDGTAYEAETGIQNIPVTITDLKNTAKIAFTANIDDVLTVARANVQDLVDAGCFSMTDADKDIAVNSDDQLYVIPYEEPLPVKPVQQKPGDTDWSQVDDTLYQEIYRCNNMDQTVSDFDATAKTGTCPVCGESVTWDKWSPSSGTTTVANKSIALAKDRHFYFDDSVETIKNIYINTSSGDYSICIWLNKDVTVDTSGANYLGFKTDGTGTGTINFFGEGSITDNSGDFFNLRNDGVLNLYGGTYVYGGTSVAINSNDDTGTVNIYNGATIGPETKGTAACMNVNVAAKATFNMYGGTIRNGVSNTRLKSGNVHVVQGGTFNMYGGTIQGGTHIDSITDGRGANLYAAGIVNIYGGTITGGNSYQGGNIALAGSSDFSMQGGTVKLGNANAGGNIWSAANTNTPDIGRYALIEDGVATNGGNVYVYAGEVATSGEILDGKAENRGGNIYVRGNTKLTVNGGVIANGEITNEDGQNSGWGGNIAAADGEVVINGGIIYGGSGSDGVQNNNVAVRTDAKTATTAENAPKLTITGGIIVGNIGLSATEKYTDENEEEQTITGTQVAISRDAQIVTTYEDKTADYGIYVGTGNEIDVTGLTANASIAVSPRKAGIALTKGSDATALNDVFVLTNDSMYKQVADGVIYVYGYNVYVVGADGETQYFPDNAAALAAYEHGTDKYVVLDTEAEISGPVVINTNGKNLTLSGTGSITLIDTKNQNFENFGEVTIADGASINFAKETFVGNDHYVTIQDGNKLSAHYVEMKLTHITLRTTANGLYYKVQIKCDDTLAGRVKTFGVVVDKDAQPTNLDDFQNYSISSVFAPVNNTVSATSLDVFNILGDRDAASNYEFLKTTVYANLYMKVNVTGSDEEGYAVMGLKAGTTVVKSLLEVVQGIDAAWATIAATDEAKLEMKKFVNRWADAAKLTDAGLAEWNAATSNIRAS